MMKGDKMAKKSSFGTIVRRRLSDITNSLPQSKSPASAEKPSLDPASKEQIDHLEKENMSLVRLIQDKNKLIEMSGLELQRMRISLQKMQLQNWNLAQTNSQMIAELNFCKEKSKSLQHDISCKEALLKSKILEVKEAEIIPGEEIKRENGKNKCNRYTRSRSLGHSTISQLIAAKEPAENKRRCLRRQSANFKMHSESSENVFEVDDVKLMPTDYPLSPVVTMAKPLAKGDLKQQSGIIHSNSSERRTSLGRPLRRAAEKVQSYKETPLNTKMRRNA